MTKNTGYQIIDFKNIDISNDDATIPGLYESISKSNGKPLYITNLNYHGRKLGDQFSASYSFIGADNQDYYGISLYTGLEHRYFAINTNDQVIAD